MVPRFIDSLVEMIRQLMPGCSCEVVRGGGAYWLEVEKWCDSYHKAMYVIVSKDGWDTKGYGIEVQVELYQGLDDVSEYWEEKGVQNNDLDSFRNRVYSRVNKMWLLYLAL